MNSKHTERLHAACSRCGGNRVDVTVLAEGRYLCRCQTCGYQWTEPGVIPARDRRKAKDL